MRLGGGRITSRNARPPRTKPRRNHDRQPVLLVENPEPVVDLDPHSNPLGDPHDRPWIDPQSLGNRGSGCEILGHLLIVVCATI